MSKSIKLKDDNYLDSSSIMHEKHEFKSKFQERLINYSPKMTEQKWIKLCNIEFDSHKQGEFIYIKIFIGYGQNGNSSQLAYIDLYGQQGWAGSKNGIMGCIAVLNNLNSPFTLNNIHLKILSKNERNYDVWFKNEGINYCCPNFIVYTSNHVTVTPIFTLSDEDPTGTECELEYKIVE